jgi:hypothetical protein
MALVMIKSSHKDSPSPLRDNSRCGSSSNNDDDNEVDTWTDWDDIVNDRINEEDNGNCDEADVVVEEEEDEGKSYQASSNEMFIYDK